MKVFLSTSFSHRVDEHGVVLPEFRNYVEDILARLRVANHDVYTAVEWDNWAISKRPLDVVVRTIFEELERADAVVAIVGNDVSAGVQWELGYANACQKPVAILPETDDVELGFWNSALVQTKHVVPADSITDVLRWLNTVSNTAVFQ